MSFIDYERLKSPADTTIPFLSRSEPFTTSQLIKDTLLQFGKLIKIAKITNNDPINNLTVRQFSPSGTLLSLSPSSAIELPAWTSYLEINPNPITGSGVLEMDLVESKDAYQQVR